VAGSSGERIPTEKAIVELTKRFKDTDTYQDERSEAFGDF